jgi:hypothetical protein
MADPIPAESVELTDEDLRKRDIVKALRESQNQRLVDFAKHLLTVSFSAIGVVLALKDKWLGTDAPPHKKLLLGIAIALFLATGLLATLAASIYTHRVSLSDYTDVDAELDRVARLRYRLTWIGFGLSAAATILVAIIAI